MAEYPCSFSSINALCIILNAISVILIMQDWFYYKALASTHSGSIGIQEKNMCQNQSRARNRRTELACC